MTVSQLKQSIESQGGTYSQFREQLTQELEFNQLFRQAVASGITVSDQDVKAFLRTYKGALANQEFHLADIVISLPDEPTPAQLHAAQTKATKVMAQIHKGENFKKLAVSNSSGEKALQAGDLGWRKLAELPTIFADQLRTMKTGQVRGPLRAPNGFHILKLLGVRSAGKKLSANEIRNLIFQRKVGQARGEWLERIRAQAYIKYL